MYQTRAITKELWDGFVASYDAANFLQSWEWGDLHQTLGDVVYRQGIYRGESLVGVLLGIVKDARRGRYLEVPGGPLIDWDDDAVVACATAELRRLANENRCVFVRLRPQLADTTQYRDLLKTHQFMLAPMHLHAEHTNILDLASTEDELLAGMRRQTRYEVRRADKQNIIVSWASNEAAIEEFYAVQADTARRQGFIPPSRAFLDAQLAAFGDKLRVYRAEKDGQLLTLALIILYGQEAEYHEGASTPEARSQPGAYAVQWQAIRDAKAMGITRYNFWGIAYTSDPKHRYAGVTTFKRGFGGQDVTYLPAHDLVIDRLKYTKNWIIETIRKKVRKL
jgi:lipid II:glycine glycyltransferase (peptidoglycan interpeptide bridge formation enzyme)